MIGLSLLCGCRSDRPDLNLLARQAVGGRHGLVIVFNPTRCSLKDEPFTHLSQVARNGGVPVIGVSTGAMPAEGALEPLKLSFGIQFPLKVDSAGAWSRLIGDLGFEDPLLIVVRHGRAVEIMTGEAVTRWTGDLPVWITMVAKERTIAW